jgi:Family of unknown function (DUF5324)
VSRLSTVRSRTAKVKKQVAPRASDARETAAGYADRFAPRVEAARHVVGPRVETARDALVPRLESAKDVVGPRLETARESLAPHLETAREKVRDDLLPKVAGAAVAALAASEPVRDEARSRGVATLAALKGELTSADVKKARRRGRRSRFGKIALVAGIAGAGFAAWRWWTKQSEPDWTVDEFRESSADQPSGAWSPTAASEAAGTSGSQISTDTAAASPDEALADAAESERLEEDTSADAWRPTR